MSQDQRASKRSDGWRTLRALAVASLCALSTLGACGQAVSDSGSNSNWLSACSSNADCAEGLSCFCGVCTVPCDSQDACTNAGATCRTYGSECVNSVGYNANICLAECASNDDCTSIRDDLECNVGVGMCRPRGGFDTTSLGGGGNSGTGGSMSLLPPGDWVSRGEPASCPSFEFPAIAEGTGPWGIVHTDSAWVTYTTGSTNPEFMFVTMAGTWDQGPLRLGLSISVDLVSGTEVASGDGIEIWMSRYLSGFVNQVEVPGVLQVESYTAPMPPGEGAPLVLKGTVVLADAEWAMSVPIDISETCAQLPPIIK
jgi:hypothetical protein